MTSHEEPEQLTVDVDEPQPGVLVAQLTGWLDLATAPGAEIQLQELLDTRAPRSIVVDLSRTEFLGSAGRRGAAAPAPRRARPRVRAAVPGRAERNRAADPARAGSARDVLDGGRRGRGDALTAAGREPGVSRVRRTGCGPRAPTGSMGRAGSSVMTTSRVRAQVRPDVHELADPDLLPSRVVVGPLARDHDDRVRDLGLGVQVQRACGVVLHQRVTVRFAVQQPQRVVLGVAEGPEVPGFGEQEVQAVELDVAGELVHRGDDARAHVIACLPDPDREQREEPLGVGGAADHRQRRPEPPLHFGEVPDDAVVGEGAVVHQERVGVGEGDLAGAGVAQVGEELARSGSLGDLPVGLVVGGLDRVAHEQLPVAGGQRGDAEPVGVVLALRSERVRGVQQPEFGGYVVGTGVQGEEAAHGGDASPRSRSSSLVRVPGRVGVGVGPWRRWCVRRSGSTRLADGVELPGWDGLAGVEALVGPEEQALEAVYFDTEDLRLARAGVTLRRRRGGHDAGLAPQAAGRPGTAATRSA